MVRKIKNIIHKYAAYVANAVFGFPSKDLYVVGVTGTDGKSTTTYYIYQILKENNKKVSMIATTGAIIEGQEEALGFHVTTPSSFVLQKIIRKVKNAKSRYLILEVTSHAIDQHRVEGIEFQIGVLTNITPEHLDYHKNFNNYKKTKLKLLEKSNMVIVGSELEDEVKEKLKGKDVTSYGLGDGSDINEKNFPLPQNTEAYNKKNILAAIAATRHMGLKDSEIKKVIPGLKTPRARQDFVYDKGYRVIIDFAHTTNSFNALLLEVKKKTKGRLIHVFGSAGGRDREKRKLMGESSSRYSDIIILTAEDPRNELLETINTQIKAGVKDFTNINQTETNIKNKSILEVPSRKEAIEHAVKIAKPQDTVLITGKGHEKSMNYGKGEEPWDEYEVVEEALQKKKLV